MSLHAYLFRLIWLCVAPLVALAGYFAYDTVRTLQTQRDGEAADRVTNIGQAVDRLISGHLAGLRLLASSPLLDEPARWADFHAEALGFSKIYGGHVILADLDLHMLLNTRVRPGTPLPSLPRPRGHAAASQTLATGQPAVGDLFTGPIANELLVALVAPVVRQTRTTHLLVNTVETQLLQRTLDAVAMPAGWSVSLLDGTGELIARRSPPQAQAAPARDTRDGRFTYKSTVTPWSLVLEVPRSVLAAPIASATATLATAVVGVTLVSLLAGYGASRRLSRAVATLTTAGYASARPGAGIIEIEAVRRSLDDAAAAQHAAEQTLRLSEGRYRTLFESNPHPMWVYDIETLAFLAVNDAAIVHYGYSREQFLAMTIRDIRPPEDVPRLLGSIPAPGAGYNGGNVWRHLKKDGSTIFVEITAHTLNFGDRAAELVLAHDVTERLRADEELQRHRHHLEELVRLRTAQLAEASERAEAANRAKSEFLANMSHEIRTPMNAIVGLTYLVRQSGVSADQALRLDKIDAAGRHLLSIINDILDLSKIEAGRLQLEQTDFHLSAILDAIGSMIAGQADAKGIKVTVDGDAVPTWLRGDATRLRQALLNYAANAIKFTEHGEVAVRARLLEETDAGLRVRFEVQDSGIGIAAEHLDTLFRAFQQADASTTRHFGGTGLGLAITKHLATLMGGEVGVQSEPGRGSTFWFTALLSRGHGIDPVPPAAAKSVAGMPPPLRHAGARVLLAEDNPVNREVALELLHGVALAVDTAADGLQAVELARDNDYDLILMDVQMPRLDGLAATRAIRALPGRGQVPILAMTANAFDEDRRACLDAGMNDFVAKPVDPANLFDTLSHWLNINAGRGRIAAGPRSGAGGSRGGGDPGVDAIAELRRLPGFDVGRGLEIWQGNVQKYLGLLHRFVASGIDEVERLRDSLAGGDTAAAAAIVHDLKGVAGTVGAMRVADCARRLEAQLRDGGQGGDLVEEIAQAVFAVAAILPAAADQRS